MHIQYQLHFQTLIFFKYKGTGQRNSPFPSIIDLPQKRHDEYIYWLSYLCWNFFFSLSWCITDWSYQTNSSMLSNYFQKMPYNKTHISSFLLQYMPLFCHSFKTIFWSLFILCVSNPMLCSYPYDCSVILLISPPPLSFSLLLCLSLCSLSF